jgi:hypothetical protein
MARVQVITGVTPQRHRGQEQKRALVAAAFAPGAVVSEVARQADLNGARCRIHDFPASGLCHTPQPAVPRQML